MIPTTVIIPAAGSGARFGNIPKQIAQLRGEPLIFYSLNEFQKNENVTSIIIATQENLIEEVKSIVSKKNLFKVKNVILGGKERQHSVMNAANYINDGTEVVLVHDAARPFVTQNVINKVIEEANRVGASIVALKINDTLKKTKNNFVEQTLDRTEVYSAQTPQAFKKENFLKMMQFSNSNNFIATDESMLAEKINIFPSIIEGSFENFKITTQIDLLLAEKILDIKR